MEPNIVAALDIGTTKVAVVIARKTEDGSVDVIGFGHQPSNQLLSKGVIVNIEATVNAIRKAVEEAEVMAGVEVEELVTSIAGGQVEGMNTSAVVAIAGRPGESEITIEDVDRAVHAAQSVSLAPNREILHVMAQEYRVDDQEGIMDAVGMIGTRLEARVHIVTCNKAATANIRKAVELAGYRVASLHLQPVAAAEAVLNDDEKELGALVIDIGGGTTDVIVILQNAVWYTHILPLGGNHVTQDIAYGLRTPRMQAEILKKQFGSALADQVPDEDVISVPIVGDQEPERRPRKELANIIEPRMEEIFSLARKKLEESGHYDKCGAGAVLTGGGAQLEGASQLAKRVLNLPVRVGKPRRVEADRKLTDKVTGPELSVAIGLARKVLQELDQDGKKGDWKERPSAEKPRGVGQFFKNFFG